MASRDATVLLLIQICDEFQTHSATKTVRLNSGYDMPILGPGTWTLNDEQAENAVYHALKDGYRLIDTVRYYGNEAGVGKGIQKAIRKGIVKREDVFVTSKVMPSDYSRAAQVLLRWQLQAGFIAIPGSGNPEHIAENYDVFDFSLSAAEMEQIAALNRGQRYENW